MNGSKLSAAFVAVTLVILFLNAKGCTTIRSLASKSAAFVFNAQMGLPIPSPSQTPLASREVIPEPRPDVVTPVVTEPPVQRPKPIPSPIVEGSAFAPVRPTPGAPLKPRGLDIFTIFELGAGFGSAAVSPAVNNACCRVGLIVGARFEIEVSETLSFVPGIRYSQKGGQANLSGSEVEVALDYVEVPLHAKLRFPIDKMEPFIFAGPSVAFNTRARGDSYGVVRDIKPMTESYDLSLDVGIGAELKVDREWSVYLANGYSLGLLDVDKSGDSWRTRSFQVLGGLKYRLP